MASATSRSTLGVLLALGSGYLLSPPVGAATITTAAVAFDNSASVTDTEGGGATSYTNVDLGSTALSQFDSSLGVLMGATVNLESTRTQAAWVKSTAGGGTNSNFNVTSNGQGSSTARLTAPGVDSSFSSVSTSDSCTDKWKNDCSGTATTGPSTATSLAGAVSAGGLDSYVGSGTVSVNRRAPVLSAEQLSNVFSGTETTTSVLTWAGTLSATYDYLLHAAPSFASDSELLTLDLDFGTVVVGSDAVIPFDIFNLAGLAGIDRVGLDLDGILGSGDTGRFLTGLAPLLGLASGASNGYLALLDTSAAGSYSATYLLRFSDADVGAASSRFDHFRLTLNLNGSVVEAQADLRNSVPEPATLALFSLGIAAMPLVRRRKVAV